MEQLSMDSILSDEKTEKVEVVNTVKTEPVVEAKTEEKVERPKSRKQAHQEREMDARGFVRDPDTGQFAPKEEKVEEKKEVKVEPKVEVKEPPKQEFTDKEKALLRGMEEERRKRQDLEKRFAALEASKKEPDKPFWDAPEEALQKMREESAQREAGLREEIKQTRLYTAEAIARRAHTDFDEKITVFGEVLQKTPGLYQQWMSSPDPAEFAYSLGKTHQELQQAGSIEGLRAKIEKETRAKLETELKEKAEAMAKERAALPPSLSDARSKGVNRPVWSGPPSMDDILKG